MTPITVINRTDDIITFQLSNDEEVIAEKIDVINDVPIFLVGRINSIHLTAIDWVDIYKFQEKLGVLLIVNRDPRIPVIGDDSCRWSFIVQPNLSINSYPKLKVFLIEHMNLDLEIQVYNVVEDNDEI